MPFLLLLDGFDEVGAVEDRGRIVTTTRQMLTALGHRARAVVVATTRPQGYAGELAHLGIPLTTRYLAQLHTEQALAYANKLAQVKIASADERERTLKRFTTAAQEAVTSRLLRTPLQVTILMALVQHGGGAPSERWNLFKAYFDFAYRREIERETYASKLLRDRRSHIQAIHTRVALILHAEGENAGGAAARISRDRLRNIVDIVLKEDEVDDDERADLVTRIIDAAEKRLVFLVEPEPGRFGFEIRSLQEFMAAWALTEGRDAVIECRLLQVAKSALFRHVVLFMASKLFYERSSLRDVLADRICDALDNDPSDSIARVTKAGGLLALDVLEEGSALLQPKRARSLMDRVTGLLALPPAPEHARMARVAAEDTAPVLRAALETCLARSSAKPAAALAAWVCIVEATNYDRRWAIDIGERFWPAGKQCQRILEACSSGDIRLGRWITSKIERTLESFTPESVLSFSDHRHRNDGSPMAAGWIGALAPQHGVARVVRFSGLNFYYHALPSEVIKKNSKKAIDTMPMSPPSWDAWKLALKFRSDPSASLLAETLRVVRVTLQRESWRSLAGRVSWPLQTCLYTAETPEDLKRFETMLSRGDLGDSADWYEAEANWQHGGSLQPSIIAVAEGLPWKKESLNAAPPLAAMSFFSDGKRSSGDDTSRLLQYTSRAITSCSTAIGRELLATLSLNLLWHLPDSAKVSLDEALEWLKLSKEQMIVLPSRRPKHIPVSWWLRVVDSKRTTLIFHHGTSSNIAREYIQHPESVGLLYRLIQYLTYSPSSEMSPDLLIRLRQVVAAQPYQAPVARADAAILRIWLGAVTGVEIPHLYSQIVACAESDPAVWYRFIQALRNSEMSSALREDLLLKCYPAMSDLTGPAVFAVDTMRAALQARRSELGTAATWDRLELPLPYPSVHSAPGRQVALPEKPVILRHLHVHNVRGLHDLRLQFELPVAAHGQWILFLGPNGSGKTTLLRSLVLALRNLQDPKIWPKGTFATQWLKMGTNSEGRISVQLGDQDEHVTRIRASESEGFSQHPKQVQPRLFPLFAYGCRRGSALGGAMREVDLGDDDGPEVATLFDEAAPLIHAETWLIQWDGDAQKNPRSRTIFDAIIAALRSLLAVSSIEVRDQRVWVSENGGVAVPFRALSDGYITSSGWFLDLLARWLHLAERSGASVDETFMKRMTGLVLLDEIDLHLHPRWQIESISRTRKLLPNMSFVVTTHNPLTLVGAKPEEIWILSVDENGVRAERGIDVPMLLTGGQIYNRYFGIQDIYPHELGKALQRYGFLSGYALRNDSEQMELQSLRNRLREAGIDPGWEEVTRVRSPTSSRKSNKRETVAEKPVIKRREAKAKRTVIPSRGVSR
ncbi:MAG TPA: hypothetical protein DCQ20_03420 [Nitrospira sp.]|nr:hypothetical protein [Nitrospira sp.]